MPAVLAEARRIRTSAQAYRYNAATREIAGRAAFPVVCRYTAATAVRPPQPARETSCVLFCASRKFACPFQRTNQKSIKPHKFAHNIWGEETTKRQNQKTNLAWRKFELVGGGTRILPLSVLWSARDNTPRPCYPPHSQASSAAREDINSETRRISEGECKCEHPSFFLHLPNAPKRRSSDCPIERRRHTNRVCQVTEPTKSISRFGKERFAGWATRTLPTRMC